MKEMFVKLMQGVEVRSAWRDTGATLGILAVLDNDYVNSLCTEHDRLVEAYFGDVAEEVFYFLYEWPRIREDSGAHIITSSGKEWNLHTLEDVVKYMEEEYGW